MISQMFPGVEVVAVNTRVYGQSRRFLCTLNMMALLTRRAVRTGGAKGVRATDQGDLHEAARRIIDPAVRHKSNSHFLFPRLPGSSRVFPLFPIAEEVF